jgi:short-subunit dehydrogenase
MKPLLELSPDYFRWVMDVNLMGSVLGVQAVGPRMVARGKGRIIITSSMGGVSVARLLSDYCASKHSLIAIAESLRQELAGTGVEVSVLCPAAVQTGLTQNTQRDLPERLAGTVGLGGAAAESAVAASKSASGGAMSPDDVATLTLAALGRGDFYIFTHPSAEERVVARSNEMSTAFARLKAG